MKSKWIMSLKISAIVYHQVCVSSSLIPFFHNLNILMESFTLFPKIFQKSIQVAKQIVNLDAHFCYQIFKFEKHMFNKLNVISCSNVAQRFFCNHSRRNSYNWFFHELLNLGTFKYFPLFVCHCSFLEIICKSDLNNFQLPAKHLQTASLYPI